MQFAALLLLTITIYNTVAEVLYLPAPELGDFIAKTIHLEIQKDSKPLLSQRISPYC